MTMTKTLPYFICVDLVKQGCQFSRIWRDSHAFDLLLTQLTNLLTHLKEITRILTQFYKIENNLLFLIIVTFVRLSVTLFICFLAAESFVVSFIEQSTPKRTKLLYFSKFSRECMPQFHHSIKRTVITSLFLYVKRSFFILNFIKICFKMLVTCLKIFSGNLKPYIASVQIKSLVFI